MELGQHQMQIVLSVIIILGAAVAAFVCDLLKGNNERLRELTLELKVRREEESKRFQMLAPPRALAAPAPAVAAAKVPQERSVVRATSSEAARQLEEPLAAKPSLATPPSLAAPVAKRPERPKRPMAPEVLACIRRGEQLAAAPKPRRVPDRVSFEHSAVDEPALIAPQAIAPQMQVIEPEVERTEVIQAAVVPPAEVPVAAAKPAGASRDWGSLLKARPQPAASESVRKYRKVAATASAASEQRRSEPALPAGFQDGFVLTRLMESRQPVSGLVVSIGASASQDANRSQPDDFRALIQSLIGPGDFAAQSGPDEFLLIYPGERGASAQRRLSQIAEQLWNFQLSSVASLSILFSWGGVEVRSESIDEAIASATERMQETRRGRRVLTMEPRADAPLRRAV